MSMSVLGLILPRQNPDGKLNWRDEQDKTQGDVVMGDL